jgi:hypothetical protein
MNFARCLYQSLQHTQYTTHKEKERVCRSFEKKGVNKKKEGARTQHTTNLFGFIDHASEQIETSTHCIQQAEQWRETDPTHTHTHTHTHINFTLSSLFCSCFQLQNTAKEVREEEKEAHIGSPKSVPRRGMTLLGNHSGFIENIKRSLPIDFWVIIEVVIGEDMHRFEPHLHTSRTCERRERERGRE